MEYITQTPPQTPRNHIVTPMYDTLKTEDRNTAFEDYFHRDNPNYCNVDFRIKEAVDERWDQMTKSFKTLMIQEDHDPLAVQQTFYCCCVTCSIPLRSHTRLLCGGDLCINQTYKGFPRHVKEDMYRYHMEQYRKKKSVEELKKELSSIKDDSDEEDDEVARWFNDTTTRCSSA